MRFADKVVVFAVGLKIELVNSTIEFITFPKRTF